VVPKPGQPRGVAARDRVAQRPSGSADGSSFFDGLNVDRATGIVDQPRRPRFKACTNYDNCVGGGIRTEIGLRVKAGPELVHLAEVKVAQPGDAQAGARRVVA
jgi:hypothetical protein